jgi:DNA invertase Pin-like site-specific DNA recombinase
MRTNPAKRVALYARVSTDQQVGLNQLRELHAIGQQHQWDVTGVFFDRGVSGAKGRAERPQLDKLLRGVVRGEFDLVAAWSVDRLGRSLPDLLATLAELHAKGVDLYLHQQGIDTATPAGKAMFQMMGVFAEFERAMTQERVKAGLARARGEGKVLGRPKVGESVERQIVALRTQGLGIVKIAKTAGCGVSTVQRVVRETRLSPAIGARR